MPHSLYEPDAWLTAEQYATNFVADECRRRSCHPDEVDDDDIKLALAEQVLRSPLFTARNFFHTISKPPKNELVLGDPFKAQIVLDITCESQRRREVGERVITIKYRQLGSTTWFLFRGMWYGIQPNGTIVVMVPDDEVSKQVNRRVGDIYNNLGWMTPMRRIDNQRNVVFSNPDARTRDFDKGLESQVVVVVPGPMRGLTSIRTIILSEFAHVADTAQVETADMLDGILTGMAKGGGTAVYIDSTANGYDEDYWPMVEEAVERNPKWVKRWEKLPFLSREDIINGAMGEPDRPDEGWVPYFFPAQAHEEYRTRDEHPLGQRPKMTPKRKQHLEATLGKEEKYGGDEELELFKKHGATYGFLDWRRYTIDNDIQGFDHRQKLLTFRQEYVTGDWRSCFVDYGNTVFDPLGLEALGRMVKDPSARGILEQQNVGGTLRWSIVDNLYPWDEMRFWAPPEGSEQFVLSGDLGWAFESSECDQTYVQVLRRRDRKQCAVYESRAPMHRVRQCIFSLYKFYNNAYTGIETKGPGKNLVRELFDMGLTNQYRWKRLDTDIVEDTKFLGWETSHHTRGTMEGALIEEVARRDAAGRPEPGVILRDKKTVDQLRSLKRYQEDAGKIKARGSGHDDAADSLMIGLAIDRDTNHPYVPKRRVQERAVEGTLASYQKLMTLGRMPSRNAPRLEDL